MAKRKEIGVAVIVGQQDCGEEYDANDLEAIGETFKCAAHFMRERKHGRVVCEFSNGSAGLAEIILDDGRKMSDTQFMRPDAYPLLETITYPEKPTRANKKRTRKAAA
jgi:hypothetical protein